MIAAQRVPRTSASAVEPGGTTTRHAPRRGVLQRTCDCGSTPGPTGECAACRRKQPPRLQAKLVVNRPGDRWEREADAVAEEVMRAPQSQPVAAPARVQRLDSAYTGPADAGPAVDGALRSPGRPLDPATQGFMEDRLGHDFSRVRVHTGAGAAAAARAVRARAFTVGQDVVFDGGQYAPDTTSGRALLAHELVHTVQQRSAPVPALQRFVACESEEECPPRNDGEVRRSRTEPMVVGSYSNSAVGLLVGNFAVGGSDLKADLASAAAWQTFQRRMGSDPSRRWGILGFSDCKGDEAVNTGLRNARAEALHAALSGDARTRVQGSPRGAPLSDCLFDNSTESNRAYNRSALIRLMATELTFPPTEVEVPVEEDEPAPEQPCPSYEDYLGPVLGDPPHFFTDLAECVCLGIKVTDLFDDALRYLPLAGRALDNERVQQAISIADCLCGIYDLAQLIWELGREPEPCWSLSNLSAGDVGRISLMVGAVGVDCTASTIANGLTEWLDELIAEKTAEAGGAAGGPVGALAGGIFGYAIGMWTQERAEWLVEFFLDVMAEMAQNYITYGTPFPLDACRSCTRLAQTLGVDYSPADCDRWNETLVPEAIRFPSLHGASE